MVGAGFIGLEIAATALALGGEVTVVEIAERPLGRAVSTEMSAFFLSADRAFGAKFLLGVGITAIHGASGRANAVELSSGELLPADAVIVGVGITAEDVLAREAGLACDRGSSSTRSCDVRSHDLGDRRLRAVSERILERPAASGIGAERDRSGRGGRAPPLRQTGVYSALPWFWSDQGDLKWQIAGSRTASIAGWCAAIPRPRFRDRRFPRRKLAVVETVKRGREHMAARQIIGAGTPITPEEAADLGSTCGSWRWGRGGSGI